MRQILKTTDLSLAESLRIALEGKGIAVAVHDAGAGSLPFIPISVAVAEDDYEEAVVLLRGLQPTSGVALYHDRRVGRPVRLALLLVLALAALLCIEIVP